VHLVGGTTRIYYDALNSERQKFKNVALKDFVAMNYEPDRMYKAAAKR
jgi:hypothetical protein